MTESDKLIATAEASSIRNGFLSSPGKKYRLAA
jgi:hypothetical protein